MLQVFAPAAHGEQLVLVGPSVAAEPAQVLGGGRLGVRAAGDEVQRQKVAHGAAVLAAEAGEGGGGEAPRPDHRRQHLPADGPRHRPRHLRVVH
eukprot:281725-Prorocentrum_minimum.AAC.1